jgi:hypothetical protein
MESVSFPYGPYPGIIACTAVFSRFGLGPWCATALVVGNWGGDQAHQAATRLHSVSEKIQRVAEIALAQATAALFYNFVFNMTVYCADAAGMNAALIPYYPLSRGLFDAWGGMAFGFVMGVGQALCRS